MSAHLVAAKVAGCTTGKRAHQASVALGLCVGICRAVLRLAIVLLLALRILVLGVGARLGELVVGLRAGICALVIVLPGGL